MTSHVRMYEKLIMLLSTSAPGGNKSCSPLPSFSRVQRTTLWALFIVLFYDREKGWAGLGWAGLGRALLCVYVQVFSLWGRPSPFPLVPAE